jgi:hypothetical protein
MSVARGLLTGFLGGAIADKEAKDKNKAEVLKTAANNYLTDIYPKTVEAENTRKSNFEILSSAYTPEFANVADASGFTIDKVAMDRLDKLMKKNKIDKAKLEAANFGTTYEDRYNERGLTFNQKYKPIFEQIGIKEIGGMGPYTVKSQLEGDVTTDTMADTSKTITTPMEQNVDFSPMQLSEFLIPTQSNVLMSENEYAKVAMNYRGFDQFIKPNPDDPDGTPIIVGLTGSNRVEYNALRQVTYSVLPNLKVGDDGKAQISRAVGLASAQLDRQTGDIIFGKQTAQGYQSGMLEVIGSGDNIKYTGQLTGALKNLSAVEQKQYFQQGLSALSTREEQQYFAETFPDNVTFNDGTSIKAFLKRVSGLDKIQRQTLGN